MLGRIGRKLVQDKPKGRRVFGREEDGRTLDREALPVGGIGRKLLARQGREIGSPPIRVSEERMSGRERRKTPVKASSELLQRRATAQALALFQGFALGDVMGAFEHKHKAAALEGFKLEPGLDRELAPIFRSLNELAAPASLARKLLLHLVKRKTDPC